MAVQGPQWKKTFSSRQPDLYSNEDHRIQVGPKESVVDVFLDCGGLALGPPQRYEALRAFLEKAKVAVSSSHKGVPQSEQTAIVDERCDPAPSVAGAGNEYASFSRAWNHPAYMNNPPPGLHPKVSVYNAEGLYRHMKKPRKESAERRIVYVTDLNPTMALAIIMNVAYVHLPEIRSFFARHIGFDPYIKVSQSRGFVLEFHIPHFVLRTDQESRRDERGLRKCRYTQAAVGGKRQPESIYEAQMSLIVCGMDEFFWTAYFFVDTYYSRQDSMNHYVRKKLDAPSGGYLKQESPVWDPRYYFLTVLSIRLSQVTLEWTSLVHTLEESLDPHSDADDLSLPNFVDNDPVMERTKQRTWTIGALRRLRNSLIKLITTWNTFDSEQSVLFDLRMEGILFDKFRERFAYMREKIGELKSLHMTLDQRIETLEKLNQEVLNYWQVLMLGKRLRLDCI